MGGHHPKRTTCRQVSLTLALALLLATGAMLVPASGAQAASKNRGVVLVKSIDASNLTAVGKMLYFTADDGVHGAELWRSNGTARGTRLVKDITPGNSATGSGPGALTNVAGTLFFVDSDGTQGGLWRSDGTAAGTILIREVGAGDLTDVNGTLYFVGSDAGNSGLWRSDGTASGTVLVKESEGTQICGGDLCYLTNVAGTLFFAADHGTQFAPWRSDGTKAGTIPLKDGLIATDLTAVGSTLYFTTRDFSDSWL